MNNERLTMLGSRSGLLQACHLPKWKEYNHVFLGPRVDEFIVRLIGSAKVFLEFGYMASSVVGSTCRAAWHV